MTWAGCTLTLSARKKVIGYHFFRPSRLIRCTTMRAKASSTKLTKIEAYVHFANWKGAARQKALEVQNLITKSKIT